MVKNQGVELNSLKAGMKASDIDEKNKAGKSVFDAIDTDGNGVIDENEIGMFRKDIDSDGDNTISKKEADKYLKDKELKDVDKKEVLKFLAEMITDTENVKEVRVVEKNGKKVVQVTYNNGSVDLINDDKSYSHITTDENGNEITEEYTADRKPERKTVKAQNKDVTVTEYEQDGKTVKQEVKTVADSGEVTTTNYKEGKPVSKDVERGTTLTHYEVDSEGNAQKKSMIVNKDDPEKQKVTTYERNEDGTVTATTTDALNPKKKSVKTITNNEGNEVVTNEVVTDGDSRTERTPTENGFREVTTIPEGRIETEYNNDNHRIKQTKTINGTEYVIEYDGEGNTIGIVVQNGESISKIAKDFGTTTEQLIELNSDKIKGSGNRKFFNVGEKIKVPGELEADNSAITKRKSQEETRADYAKDEAIREQRRAEARARAEEQARVKEEAAARKKITFTEKKHKTFEELARGLFNGEGVKNPTKQQLQERIKQLKEANPNVKDGELIGKRITAPVAEGVHDRIATKEKKAAAAKQKAVENGKLQKESARQIADELIKATKGLNDEKAIKKALAKIDNPAELKEVERLLEAKGYKRDQYYSPLEKFMYKEMSGSKIYDKSSDDMEEIVKKYIQNGALSGEDAINAQARLAARLIIDGCDGLGTDVDETKEGIRLIKTPKSTGNAATDKANAKKVYDKVNNIIKNHKSFGASFKGLKDYLEGDLWASEIKYLDGILAENNAIQGKQKSQAVKDLVQEAVEGAGTDIEYLKQAIKAIDSPEDRKAIEKELEAYCKKKGIKPQIAGQSYLQAILYDECDTFLGVSTDHKEIRKFNEMLIAQGAYTPEEAAKLRAEQAALQILDGNFDGIQDAVKQIKDPQVYAQMNALIATKGKNKGYNDIDSFMKKRGFSQTQCDLINAEFASKKLIDEAKSVEVASRLLQNSDFDTRAMGFKAIATGDIALAVDKALKAKGTSLAKITEQFNKEKAENKSKAAKWDGIAGVLGGFSPLGYIAEHISDQYNENTEVSDNLYVENKTPQNITPEQKAAYDMTVKTFEEQLNKMKQDYQDALDSQGVVSGALNAFCSVYNIGTTRDDIEARIKHDEETLKLLKLAADGKLAKVKDGKTEAVSFEAVFKERASEFITANGASISAIKNKYNPKEVTEFSTEKVEKVAKKAETIVAMDYAKDNISVCWNELNKGLNSKNNKELSVAICDTMEKLSQMSGKQLSLDAFGYKVSNGVIVDNSGNPVSAGKLNEIATQLKQGLSDVTKELMGVSIPANASDSDVTDILQDAYDDKMEAFKQEYRDAFGQQATDEMIENYMTTINSAKMVVNFGLLIGAAIAAPFTGGGSLAVFAATAGVSFGMNALEKSTDADGYTNSEWTADAEQAMWDGALTALGFKIGQAADVFAKGGQGFLQAAAQNNKWLAKLAANLPADKAAKVEATLAKLSQLSNVKAANISAKIIDKNKALVTKFLPNANPATVEKATICLARMEALGFEETSDTIQSLLQTYCQEGQFNAEAFTQALIMSAIGNAAGHTFSAFGDVKNVGAVKNVDDVFKDIKGVDGKPLFTGDELDDLFKQNPGFKDLPTEELNGLKQKVAILAQLSNSDGSAIFTAADLKSLLNKQNLSAFTVDQLKAMSDKAMALKNLKGADGTPILKANELNNIVKAGGIYINDIPDDVFKRLLLEPNANSTLPGLLAELKSADDAKLINTLLSPVNGNTNLKFKISDIEDILESKHKSGITDFNGFTQEIMQQLSKELIITNPETMAVGILRNIKNDFQVSAFKDLIPNLSKCDMDYEKLSWIAGTLKRTEDVDAVKAFIKQAIDDAEVGSSANLDDMISCYSTLGDLVDDAKAQDFYLKVLSDLSKSGVKTDKVFDAVRSSMAKVKFGINIDSLDEGVIAAAIKSGDIDRIRFALNTTKTDISSDTPIMRYIQKHGNVPFDIDELKKIKTNSPIQENAFDMILDNNTAERFESSAIQEMINNVKSQKDLDNLKELLMLEVNDQPLNGHTIIESLKSGTVDPEAIAKMNPHNGVPFRHLQSGIAHIKGKYPISTDNAKRLAILGVSNKKRYDKIMNSGLLDLIKEGKVDESILKNIDENTFLSNRTLKDIRKLANGESLITTLKKQSDLSNISKFVENGDVCELNGKLFVNDNGKAVEIKLSKQKFEELFPPLSRVSFEQGHLGDCWLVSTLDNLMDLSDGRVALYKLFEQQGNDVLIKFPGVDKAVKFPNGRSIQSINGKQLLSPAQDAKGVLAHEGTAEGILMIEQAYAVHRLKEGARAYNANSSVTDISSFADVDVLMERARSGWQEEAINEIFGRKIATDHYGTDITNRQQMIDLIKKYAEDDKVLISFGTIDNGKVESELSKKYDIYSTHAYSIKGYDEKTGMVYITNPWHTSVVTEIPMYELTKYMRHVTVAKFDGVGSIPTPPPYRGSVASPARSAASSASPAHTSASAARAAENSSSAVHRADINAPKTQAVSASVLSGTEAKYIAKYTKNPQATTEVFEALTEKIKNGEVPSREMLEAVTSDIAAKHGLKQIDLVRDFSKGTKVVSGWDNIEPMFRKPEADVLQKLESGQGKALARFKEKRGLLSDTELKAKQEAQLKAQQEAELKAQKETQLKAQREAELKAHQEAELKTQKEAQRLQQETLEKFADKYPEVVADGAFRNSDSAAKLIALMEKYDLQMGYSDFNAQSLYREISAAGIRNDADMDTAFEMIKKRFHPDVIAEEARVKTLKQQYHFSNYETIVHSDKVITGLQKRMADGGKITMDDIDEMIQDNIPDVREFNNIKKRILEAPELQKGLNDNLHLDVYSNPKYSSVEDGISNAMTILDNILADVKNGETPSLELIQKHIDRLDAKLRQDGKFVTVDSYYVLQDVLRNHDTLAPQCRGFVEDIIQGGFDPEPSALSSARTAKGASASSSADRSFNRNVFEGFDFDKIATQRHQESLSNLVKNNGFNAKTLENLDRDTVYNLESMVSQINKNAYLYKGGNDFYKVNVDDLLKSIDDTQMRTRIVGLLEQNPQYKSYIIESYTSPEFKNLQSMYGRKSEDVAAYIREKIADCKSVKDVGILDKYIKDAYSSTGVTTAYDGLAEQLKAKRDELVGNAYTHMDNVHDLSMLPSVDNFKKTIEKQIAEAQTLDDINLLSKDLNDYKAHTSVGTDYSNIETLMQEKRNSLLTDNLGQKLENAQHFDDLVKVQGNSKFEALAAQRRTEIKAKALEAEKDFLSGKSVPDEKTMKDIILSRLEDAKTLDDLVPLVEELKLYDSKTNMYHGEINSFIIGKRTELRMPIINEYKTDILNQLKSCDTQEGFEALKDNYAKFKETNTQYSISKDEKKLFSEIDAAFENAKRNIRPTQDVTPTVSQNKNANSLNQEDFDKMFGKGMFSRFKRFTKSIIFGKSDEKILTSTKVSDKISALSSITDMSGKPKFSERELEEFKRMLDFYVERGGAIADIPLNTMYAAACLPGVKSPNDLMKLLVGTSTDVDKREMLNFLINTNSVSVKEGMLTAAKSGVQVDAEFVKYLLGFTQHNSNNTGKAKLLETIFDKNGPIRPALGKLDRNTAVEISDILNNVKSPDDVNNILGYIEKFKNANPKGTKLDLQTLNTIIEVENAAKVGRNIPRAAVTPFARPVLTKQEVLDRIKEMNKHPDYGVKYQQKALDEFFKDFDWDNADKHLKNLQPIFDNELSIISMKNKGWFSSAEGAQAFEEARQLYSFYQRGSVRSDMDMLLTSMTPADWKNAKAIGLVDFARNNGLDPLELKKMCKLTKQEFKNLINSGLAAEGLGYASDNADINNLYINIARRDYYRLRGLTYKDGQKTIEDAIKKATGNDPAKIKEFTLKMQKLNNKQLAEIVDWQGNLTPDIEYYVNNVDRIYNNVHKVIKNFDDESFSNSFYDMARSITKENGHLVDQLLELDGIDQAKLYGAMTYADTPAKVHHLEVLIDKIKSGEETILAIPFVKNSEINPRIAQAKYAQLPKFEVGTKPDSLLGSTKQGQTAAIGNKLYINDRGKMVELGISADTYEKLFPSYKTLCIQQGDKTGDCYFLSGGLIAFMKNDYARVDLLKLLKQEGDDIVVTIPAFPKHPVRFKNGTLDLQSLHADTSIGNLMIEQAYAKARYAAANNISDASKVDADKAMEFIYGGHENAVFNELLGTKDAKAYVNKSYSDSETPPPNATYIGQKDMQTILDKYAGRDDVLLCGGSGHRDAGYLPEYGVTPNHAYCIEKIDSQNKTVTIINPYNSLYCMTLSYDQFTQYFASLAVKELKTTA